MSNKNENLAALAGICGAIIVIYSIVVAITCLAALTGENPSFSNSSIAKEAFGLESGKEYPLKFGERIQGSSGEATAHAGFFSASASDQPWSGLWTGQRTTPGAPNFAA